MLSELSHRKADRHQFPYRHKPWLPQGIKLGSSILLCSNSLFSSDNSKHHWHLHLGLFHIILYSARTHPLISVLFALTIPATTCPPLSQCLSFCFIISIFAVSVPSCLAVPLKHVTQVCFISVPPDVYLIYLRGKVVLANPVFRWLFSTLRGELTKPEVSSSYKTPWPEVSYDTVGIHKNMHTCLGWLAHANAKAHWAFLSMAAGSFSISLSLFFFRKLLYHFEFHLSASSLIPGQSESCSHYDSLIWSPWRFALVPMRCLSSSAPLLFKPFSHRGTVRSLADWMEPYHVCIILSTEGEENHFSRGEQLPSLQPNPGCVIK